MGKPTGYRLTSYAAMISDRPRVDAYVDALRQALRPGHVVLDLGAGTGIFSLLACQLGAGHVHAVEPDDAIEVARTMAAANGWAEQITFHQMLSTAVRLPMPADVIISDLRGVLPLFQQHIPSIVDVRRRLLATGGVLIPRCDRLWGALVEDPKLYRAYAEPWLTNHYGLDLSAGHPLVVNTWRKTNASPEQLLVKPQHWATLDYTSIENPNVAGELAWTAECARTAHALLIWFDAELGDGIGFSNAPGQPELIYGQASFPLQAPVVVAEGDMIAVQLQANLVAGDYVWGWNTQVTTPGDSGRMKANFRQSTFFGAPVSPAKLKRREAGFIPPATREAEIDRLCLSLVNGETPLGNIARQLRERFPERFPRWEDALTHVGDLLRRYDQVDTS
jgi:protein arginine N-methyltransferase 1